MSYWHCGLPQYTTVKISSMSGLHLEHKEFTGLTWYCLWLKFNRGWKLFEITILKIVTKMYLNFMNLNSRIPEDIEHVDIQFSAFPWKLTF